MVERRDERNRQDITLFFHSNSVNQPTCVSHLTFYVLHRRHRPELLWLDDVNTRNSDSSSMAVVIVVASSGSSSGESGSTQATIAKKNIAPDQRVEI